MKKLVEARSSGETCHACCPARTCWKKLKRSAQREDGGEILKLRVSVQQTAKVRRGRFNVKRKSEYEGEPPVQGVKSEVSFGSFTV